jgi:hypothetical protein
VSSNVVTALLLPARRVVDGATLTLIEAVSVTPPEVTV